MRDKQHSFQELVGIVERLRSPGGCPWDREQTHASLKRNLIEECYEALEAIDIDDPAGLSEELGDILVQVVFHSQMAAESSRFSIDDVVAGVADKLVRRHPHVFGDGSAKDAREVELNWDQLKKRENEQKSTLDGIPKDLPALARAQLTQDRVGREGFEWEDISGVLDKVVEEAAEIRNAVDDDERAREIGDLLFTVVNLARWQGVHAEESLRQTNLRFQARYTTMETLAKERGLDFRLLPLADKERLWQEAKGMEV